MADEHPREMNVALDVVDLTETRTPQLSCSACEVIPGAEAPENWSGSCGPVKVLCEAESNISVRQPEPPLQALGQIISLQIGLCEHLGSYDLVFELDVERAQARACVIESSDVSADPRREPLCASSGQIRLSAALIEGAPLTGDFVLRFPNYSPWSEFEPFIQGLEMEGSF